MPTKEELTPVKIRKTTYRVLKTVSAWKGLSVLDYLDQLVARESQTDLLDMAKEISAITQDGQGQNRPPARPGGKTPKAP